MVNYDTTYSETAHKYYLKVFYNKINKKEYNLQIQYYNIYYTNIMAIKSIIILEKARKEEMLSSEDIANIIVSAKVAQVLSPINFIGRYN